jgi:hypothetical protein
VLTRALEEPTLRGHLASIGNAYKPLVTRMRQDRHASVEAFQRGRAAGWVRWRYANKDDAWRWNELRDDAEHADIGMTLNLYSHVVPGMQRAASDRLAALLGS